MTDRKKMFEFSRYTKERAKYIQQSRRWFSILNIFRRFFLDTENNKRKHKEIDEKVARN